jgi:hypothetical protein
MINLNSNMKTNFLVISLLFTCFFGFAQPGSISLPELSVFYTNWDNKIIPSIPCGDSLEIKIEGATATPFTWQSDENTLKGFKVNVLSGTRQVSIELFGVDQNKVKKSYGVFLYKVKPFPSAQIQGSTISRSNGTKVILSLGIDSPFTGVNFTVTGGEITIGDKVCAFSGDRIPAEVVAECKPEDRITIDVFHTRNGEKQRPVSGSLNVTP